MAILAQLQQRCRVGCDIGGGTRHGEMLAAGSEVAVQRRKDGRLGYL